MFLFTMIPVWGLTLALGLFLTGCAGTRPDNLGPRAGRLSPCPASPNCVSSQGSDKEHAIEPLSYTGSADAAMADLKNLLLGMNRVRIADEQKGYLLCGVHQCPLPVRR